MAHPDPITLSLNAMATRFELLLHGEDPVRLRAAGEEALAEIARLHRQLNFYDQSSEISFINRQAALAPVRVDPRLFRLLAECASLSGLTSGSFDVTVGPLVDLWRAAGDTGRLPADAEIHAVRQRVGMHLVELDEKEYAVHFRHPGVEIDLGAYAKGYAIGRAVDLLREAGVASALLHGGTSSVYAIGGPPGQSAWRVALQEPLGGQSDPACIDLNDAALSVSAVHGRSFVVDGKAYGHVIDPTRGEPVTGALAAAAIGPSPAVCEALSTGLLVASDCNEGFPTRAQWSGGFLARFPGYRAMLALEANGRVSRLQLP
ncbi:MAG TPA: FAD:protein FMN transferase [Blastocatellia bacterium]|nr:FAD:protein FMN transferase [Blastocatellia bacterium]